MSLDPALPSAVWQVMLPWFAKRDRWRKPIGELGDQLVQFATDAVRLRFPSLTPDERSLVLLGLDRRIPRAPNEPAEAYARRLELWLDLWGLAGLPIGLLYAIQSYVFPGYPLVRLVERSGLWYTLDEAASRDFSPFDAMTLPSAVPAGTDPVRYVPPIGASTTPRAPFWAHYGAWFDWDSISQPARATHVEDYVLFVYPPSYAFQGTYNSGITYNSGTCWGLAVSPGVITTLRDLLAIDARAGSHCLSVVFPESTTLYSPDATPDGDWPDGKWGWEAVDDGFGNVIPTRSQKNRYLLSFPGGSP